MQSIITENLDYGIPGEFATTTPRVTFPVVLKAAATMGKPLGRASNGDVAQMATSTYTTFIGIAGTTHQHINRGSTAPDALAASLAAEAGSTVICVQKGDMYVEIPYAATVSGSDEAAKKANYQSLSIAAGTSIYVTSAGVYTTDSSNNTLVGTLVYARSLSDVQAGDITISSTTGTANVVVYIRLA